MPALPPLACASQYLRNLCCALCAPHSDSSRLPIDQTMDYEYGFQAFRPDNTEFEALSTTLHWARYAIVFGPVAALLVCMLVLAVVDARRVLDEEAMRDLHVDEERLLLMRLERGAKGFERHPGEALPLYVEVEEKPPRYEEGRDRIVLLD